MVTATDYRYRQQTSLKKREDRRFITRERSPYTKQKSANFSESSIMMERSSSVIFRESQGDNQMAREVSRSSLGGFSAAALPRKSKAQFKKKDFTELAKDMQTIKDIEQRLCEDSSDDNEL